MREMNGPYITVKLSLKSLKIYAPYVVSNVFNSCFQQRIYSEPQAEIHYGKHHSRHLYDLLEQRHRRIRWKAFLK